MNKFIDWFFGLDAEGHGPFEPDTPFEFICGAIRGLTGMTDMISLALLVLKILGYFDRNLIIVFSPVICRVVLELIANFARKFARKKQAYYNKIAREEQFHDITSLPWKDGDTF